MIDLNAFSKILEKTFTNQKIDTFFFVQKQSSFPKTLHMQIFQESD